MKRISLLLLFIAIKLNAQSIDFKIGKPNCNPLIERYDNPLPNYGWTMPRIGWHILYPSISLGLAKGIDYISKGKIPPIISSSVATISIGLLPHILGGLVERNYPIDVMDWSFDLWNNSLPSFVYLSSTERDRKNSKRDYLIYAGGDLILSCFGHP